MMQTDRYFTQALSLFFRWEDGGTVLCWDNGATIAFREELAAVINRLGSEGLPPLNTIAVLLSACRANWFEARCYLMLYDSPEGLQDTPVLQDPESWQAGQLRRFLAELDRIHALPESLRSSLEARCELVAMVVEDRSSEWNRELIELLADRVRAGLPEDLQSQGGFLQTIGELELDLVSSLKLYSTTGVPTQVVPIAAAATDLTRDLNWLGDNLKRVDADALSRRLRTGIESEVLPAEDLDPDDRNTRDLIRELIGDEEFGGIAKLAENLLAVVHFPRSLTEQNDLPLGGVSDITNRGQLDRLLLSELAHDDLTLAVRIAVNEAMYLRRESPPKSQSQTRHLMIDAGLCLWGIPRVFATSVALAMSATTEKNVRTVAYRAEGKLLQPVDLKSREGLEDHLSVVSPSLHSGAAIGEFISINDSDELVDHVVITSDDVVADADFRRELTAASQESPVYLVTVSRAGKLEFSVWSARGRKTIREATLNLDALLDTPNRQHSLKRRNTDTSFPMILSRENFPFRLPHAVLNEVMFDLNGDALTVTSDGRLMLWDRPNVGAIQLSDQILGGKPLWQGWDESGRLMLVCGFLMPDALRLITVDDQHEVEITRLESGQPSYKVTGFGGQVFVVSKTLVEAFVPGSSKPVGSLEIPVDLSDATSIGTSSNCPVNQKSASSRFFVSGDKWFALAPGVNGPVLEKVPTEPLTIGLFDQRGLGIVSIFATDLALRRSGDTPGIFCHESLWRISNDGCMLLSQINALVEQRNTRINVNYGGSDAPQYIQEKLYQRVSDRALRNRFSGIGVSNQRLFLRTNKGDVLIVETDSPLLLRKIRPADGAMQNVVPFQDTPSPAGTRYTLKVAEWEDGSRAWLDSRCLLHLRTSSREVPEATIVLSEGQLCGWCEEGGYFGKGYFNPDAEVTDPERDAEICRKAIDGFAEFL